MGIVLRHDAAVIPPLLGGQDRTKYGQALALQQRSDDMSTRQRLQTQQYDTQKMYSNQNFLLNRDLGNNMADLDQAIAKGQFDPVVAKKLRQSLALEAEAMSNPGIDATQRAEALQIARAQRVPLLALRRDVAQEPTVTDQFNQRRHAEGGRQWLQNSKGDFDEITPQSQPQAPMSAREAFNQNPKMESDYLKIAGEYLRDPENPAALPDRNKLWDKAEELWGIDQMRRRGPAPTRAPIPANDGPMGPAAPPAPGSRGYINTQPFAEGQGVANPSRATQASTGRGYIFIKPSGKSVTELGDPIAQQQTHAASDAPANPWEGVVSPTGQPMTADTHYDMKHLDRGPGTNFFDPENPTYAAMRAPQMQQPQAAPQYAGQYGLGGVNFGVNQGTGNNVSASVRPGGTMLQYDQPTTVRAPITDANFPSRVQASPGDRVVDSQQSFRDQQAAANPWMETAKAVSTAMSSPASTTPLPAEDAKRQMKYLKSLSENPEELSDADRAKYGLPSSSEVQQMRKNMGKNKSMGGIGLGGSGIAAGSTSLLDQLNSADKATSNASVPPEVAGDAIKSFLSEGQPPEVEKAFAIANNPKLSKSEKKEAVKFLLSRGIDLSEIVKKYAVASRN